MFSEIISKCYTIIDCTEIFTETPSSLKAHNLFWSDYKLYTTIKILVCITPNCAISWVSKAYGGHKNDVHIVRTCGFLNIIKPYDQIMADQRFKIKIDLAMSQCALAVPPSAACGRK